MFPPFSADLFFQFETTAPEFFNIGIKGDMSKVFKLVPITASNLPSAANSN